MAVFTGEAFQVSTGKAEFRGFEVKMEEAAEPPEPADLENKINFFKRTLTPILETPYSYLAIIKLLVERFPPYTTENLRTVLKYTLNTANRFTKIGR